MGRRRVRWAWRSDRSEPLPLGVTDPNELFGREVEVRDQGLVQTRRESQTIYYRLEDSAAMSILELLHDFYCKT